MNEGQPYRSQTCKVLAHRIFRGDYPLKQVLGPPPLKRHNHELVVTSLRRPTAASASRRNVCVANLAHRILILHAAQSSKTEALCQQALVAAKPVYTLPSPPTTAHLIALGALPIPPNDPSALLPD